MAYNCDYSYDYPIMGKLWKHRCHFCHRDLREVPKERIVKGERWWGFDEPHFERHWYCNKDCARAEHQEIIRNAEETKTSLDELNDYIKESK